MKCTGNAVCEIRRRIGSLSMVAMLLFLTGGCASTRIAIAEKFGYAKREQLVDRVEEARDEQEEAKEQFASALEEFLALTEVDGGDLEETYDRLDKELKRSEDQADDVRSRIRDVERVADALFEEWEQELDEYANPDLRRTSAEQLSTTKARYGELLGVMKQAEAKMDPVLAAFNDQVLFLKHNLNARAIASLEGNFAALESEIAALISDMEASINEANSFIEEMGAS